MSDDRNDALTEDSAAPDMTAMETLSTLGIALGEPVTFRSERRSPDRSRRLRWQIAAAAILTLPFSLAVAGKALEAVGLETLAGIVRTPQAIARAALRPAAGFTATTMVSRIVSGTPSLFIGGLAGDQIGGTVANVPYGQVKVAAYLYVDPADALAHDCFAQGWYGSKPRAGHAASVGALGGWSLQWQSPRSDETGKTCDDLASQLLVVLLPEQYTTPDLSDDGRELPKELLEHALDAAQMPLR